MASEQPQGTEQTKPLEEKIADLNLQDKGDAIAVATKEYIDVVKEAVTISSADAKEVFGECKEAISASLNESGKEEGKPSEEPVPDERDVASREVAKSADESAYAVPTVDHRSVAGPGGEEKKVDVPTAVVHENADTVGKEQQGKGIVSKISSSVKSYFTGMTGSKGAKNSDEPQK